MIPFGVLAQQQHVTGYIPAPDIEFVNSNFVYPGTSGSVSVARPAVQEGDLMIAQVNTRNSYLTAVSDGWTPLWQHGIGSTGSFQARGGTFNEETHAYYKFAGASEPANYTFTCSGTNNCIGISVFRNVSGVTFTDNTHNAPNTNVAPSNDGAVGDMLVCINGTSYEAVDHPIVPADMIEGGWIYNASQDVGTIMAYKTIAVGGAQGSKTFTGDIWNSYAASASLVLKQLPSVGQPPIVLIPVDDAYVRSGPTYSNTNYGTDASLVMKNNTEAGDYNRQSFIKFDKSALAPLTSATLHLYISNRNVDPDITLQIFEVDTDTWTEETITFNNHPEHGALIASVPIPEVDAIGWYEIDVTSYVLNHANDLISFRLQNLEDTASSNCSVASKETAWPPKLVVEEAVQIASDTFTDTDAVLAQNHTMDQGAGWDYVYQTSLSSPSGSALIDSNELKFDTNSHLLVTDLGVSDYYIEIDWTPTAAVNQRNSLVMRWGSTGDFYMCNFRCDVDDVQLFSLIGDTQTAIISTQAYNFTPGQTYKIAASVVGNQLTFLVDGEVQYTYTMTAHSGNTFAGVMRNGGADDTRFDNFKAYDVTPPPFFPTMIEGLQTWLDGSDPGETANVWEDKSGSGRGNWVKHPSYNMPPLNSPSYELGAAYFANSHVINGPSYADMSEGEIFVRLKNGDSTDNGLWYFSNKSDNGDWYPYSGSSVYLGWGTNYRPGFGHGITMTNYHTLNIWSALNDWALNINGVTKGTQVNRTPTWVSNPYIGKMAAANYFYHGYIKALCIFDRKLSSNERAQMNAYMDSL